MRIIIQSSLILLGIVALYLSANSLTKDHKQEYKILQKPPLADLETPMLDAVTLGHRSLYDDVAAIWILQILTEKNLRQEDPKELADVVMSVLKHQPKLETLYLMSCFTLMIDMKYPEGCEPITMAGLEAFPESWLIPVTQAYVYGNDLGENYKAGVFYQLAGTKPYAPPYLTKVGKKLLSGSHFDSQDAIDTLKKMGETEAGKNLSRILMQSKKNKQSETPQDE